MKKKLLLTTLLFCIICSNLTHARVVEDDFQKPIPPYAKWGQMAMKETMKRYPNVCIVDYLHIGRDIGPVESTEKFKLWMQACPTKREFGVFVRITFNNQTEEVTDIQFQETDR